MLNNIHYFYFFYIIKWKYLNNSIIYKIDLQTLTVHYSTLYEINYFWSFLLSQLESAEILSTEEYKK